MLIRSLMEFIIADSVNVGVPAKGWFAAVFLASTWAFREGCGGDRADQYCQISGGGSGAWRSEWCLAEGVVRRA